MTIRHLQAGTTLALTYGLLLSGSALADGTRFSDFVPLTNSAPPPKA